MKFGCRCIFLTCGNCLFFCASLGAEGAEDNSGNLSGNEDVVSLSDIVPETNICFVSLRDDSIQF